MHVLTLWPEWAWAISALGKDVENRTWPAPRVLLHPDARLAIHAGMSPGGRQDRQAAARALADVAYMAARAGWSVERGLQWWWSHPDRPDGILFSPGHLAHIQGRIVATVRVTGTSTPIGREGSTAASPWAVPHLYAWHLADVRQADSDRFRGRQGVWSVPARDVRQAGAP